MNTSIPLQSVRPHIMTPEEGLKLQDLSMQVQQEQDKVQRAAQVRQIVQEPGMFDEAGIPTTMGIQKIMSADTQLGTHFLTARGMALDQQRKMETAKLVAESKKAAIAAKEQNDQALADSRRTKAQKEQYGLFQKITTDIDEAALSAYDASVKRGEPHEESVRKMRQARVDAFEERVNSGIARSAGFNDQMIETARSKMAGDFDPDEIRERVKTKKMREQEQKAALDDPFKSRKLGQGDRSLDIRTIGQGIKASQVDRKLDIDEDKLDAKIASDERKAGVSEDAIKQRGEHSKAVIELRKAIAEQKKDTADTNSEERERHNRAVEEAKAKESDLRGKAYGMKADKATQDKGTLAGQHAEKTSLIKEKESQIATFNRELEQGKITQEQHDDAIAKLNKSGKGGKGDAVNIEVGAPKQLAARGWTFDPENPGALTFIPGGPQDPKVIAQQAQARASARGGKNTMSTTGEKYAGPQASGQDYLEEIRSQDPDYARLLDGVLKNQIAIGDIGLKRGQGARLLEDLLRINPAWKKPEKSSGKPERGVMWDHDTLRMKAEEVITGDMSPYVGLNRLPETRAALDKEVQRIAKERGMNGEQVARHIAQFQGDKSFQRSLGTRSANLSVASNELKEFTDIALEASKKVPRTGFVPLNKLVQMGTRNWSADQAAFEAATRSTINAFRQVAARTGVATVHDTEEFEKMLFSAQTDAQYRAVLNMMRKEADGAIRAAAKAREQGIEGKESGPPAGGARASPPSSPTAPAGGTGPKRDKPITATNPKTGERLMLKDGQWVPLQ